MSHMHLLLCMWQVSKAAKSICWWAVSVSELIRTQAEADLKLETIKNGEARLEKSNLYMKQ